MLSLTSYSVNMPIVCEWISNIIFGFGQPKGIPPPNYPGKASENKQYEIGVAKFEDSLKLYQRLSND